MTPFSPLVEALILWTVVAPLVVSVPLALIGWWSGKPPRTDRLDGWTLASLVGAFLVCFVGTRGGPDFPPGPAFDWLFYLAILSAGGEAAIRWLRSSAYAEVIRGSVVVLGVAVCIAPIWPQAGSYTASAGQGFLSGAVLLGVVWTTVRFTRRTRSPAFALHFVLIAAGAATVVAMSGSLALAQLAGALAASLFPFFALAVLDGRVELRASPAYLVQGLGFVSLQAWLYADTPVWSLLLLAVATALGGSLSWNWLRERGRWLPDIVWLGGLILLVAASVYLTTLPSLSGGPAAESPSESGSYRPYR